MAIELIYENDSYVFVNKPSGMLSIPDRHQVNLPSVQGQLKKRYPEIFTVHRLDKDTSGLICFAKNAESHQYLSGLFEKRGVTKIYYAIVHGTPALSKGMIDKPIAEHPVQKGKMIVHAKLGKPSQTEYELIEQFGMFSLIKCTLHTGRTHQIRVHMADLGHPVICDPLYGDGAGIFLSHLKKKFKLSKLEDEERPLMHRLALHAGILGFTEFNGNQLTLEAPLTKDMNAMLNQCRKWLH
jgi:23S rRNA pseudouridine955/2504/2580 synthase/23S rRNA pseudouridine1911/1915/1917 synthase